MNTFFRPPVRLVCGRCDRTLAVIAEPDQGVLVLVSYPHYQQRPAIYQRPDAGTFDYRAYTWTFRCRCGMTLAVRGGRLYPAYGAAFEAGRRLTIGR